MNNTLSIQFPNNEAGNKMFQCFLQEALKFNLQFSVNSVQEPTTVSVPVEKCSKPVQNGAKKTKEYKYSDETVKIVPQKDGTFIMDLKSAKNKYVLRMAVAKLPENVQRTDDYRYYVPTKAGKVSKTDTAKVIDTFKNGIVVTADDQKLYYSKWGK